MTWFKVDDQLPDHRKARAVRKSHPEKRRDAAPFGLWALAGAKSTDGFIALEILEDWDDDAEELAERLVAAGLWHRAERHGDHGYVFNDWDDQNPPRRDVASTSGSFGNHVRWHEQRGIVDPSCEHCPTESDRGDDRPDIGATGGESGLSLPTRPDPNPTRPDPNPTHPDPDPFTSAAEPADPPLVIVAGPVRDDVERICAHLADRVADNGSKRPTITKTWRDAARLMLDRDHHTEDDVHAAIEWCQRDEFWRGNVLSLPKLRDKYDQLRLQAQRRPSGGGDRQQRDQDMFDRQMARAREREQQIGTR